MRIMSFFFFFQEQKCSHETGVSANSHLRLKGHLRSFLGNLDTEIFLNHILLAVKNKKQKTH